MRHEEIAAELRWFLRESDGELGLHSNFRSIVARIEGGSGSTEVHRVDFRQVDAATRARHVSRILLGLRSYEVSILRAAFGEDDSERRLSRVMRLLPEAIEAHRQSRSTRTLADWLRRLQALAKTGQDYDRRRLFVRIHSAADIALRGALDAYAKQQRRERENRLFGEGAR